ncbi:MAG: DUF1476 domain-containing protein [Candidatus Pacebacteria bacterium]|nr:DUF1476 domain-containing protein [Candidatus Paceibacterota bacterium]
MTLFEEREQAYENQFVHEEGLKFKARSRRNKLLGLWAATELGKTELFAEDYAIEIVIAIVKYVDDDSIVDKIYKDFESAGVAKSRLQVRKKMDELFAQASREIRDGV